MTEGPCAQCPMRDTCTEVCELLEVELPSEWSGDKKWLEPFTDAEDDPFSDMLVGEREKHIDINRRVLDDVNLTIKQRQVAEMYYWEGLTQDDIAKKLGISQPTVSEFITAVKKKL